MARMKASLAFLLILVVAAVRPVAGQADQPVVRIRKISAADASRLVTPSIGYLIGRNGQSSPSQRTRASLAYDDSNLYVTFDCAESQMSELVAAYTGRDEELWRDDCVEVFLDTGHDHETYYQVIVNTAGARYDARNNAGPDSWNGDWDVSIAKRADAWTAAIAIPFSSMGVKTPTPGTVWGADFVRRRCAGSEVGYWCVVESGTHEPARFGHLVFGGGDTPAVSAERLQVGLPGAYTVRLTVGNPTNRALRLVVSPEVAGRALASEQKQFARGESVWSFPFAFSEDGRKPYCITVRDASGDIAMRTPFAMTDIPPHRTRLRSYIREANSLKASSADARRRKAEVLRGLRAASLLDRRSRHTAQQWAELGAVLDSVSPDLAILHYMCADKAASGFAVGRETCMLKVRRDQPFRGDFESPLRISACRDEFEAAQLVLVAYAKALKRVRVTVSDLKSQNGDVIAASDVQLNRVGYVRTRKPAYEVDYVGWYPDPLMGIEPFDVAQGVVQPVWVTVHPSKKTPAGIYHGEVTIAPANGPAQRVRLEVRVWDFDMPAAPHLKTAFAMCEGQLGAWYGGLTPDIRRAYYEFMLQHKINPTNIYSGVPMPAKDDLQFSVDRGLTCFNLGYISGEMGDEERAARLGTLKDYEAFLKEKGWWDKAYIYGFDEPAAERIPAIKREFGWVKEHFPDLKRMCTTPPNEQLKGYVDIWCPILHAYNPDIARKWEQAGDEVWWYVAWIPSRPYPNLLMDNPAIDHRVLFWMNWKYKVPGFLYYAVNLWTTNFTPCAARQGWCWPQAWEVLKGLKAGKRWPEIPWNTFTCSNCNGDGQLIYPGPNGKPVSSIRMELVRDGIEDYEYFCILNERIAEAEKAGKVAPSVLANARKLLEIGDDVVKTTSEFTHDPEMLLETRRQVAEAIEELRVEN